MKPLALTFVTLASLSIAACTSSQLNTSVGGQPAAEFTKEYPLAYPYKKSTRLVISPFRPYNLIDIKGLRPNQLARDISTAKADPVTKKPITSTAKIFRIPEPNLPAPSPADKTN